MGFQKQGIEYYRNVLDWKDADSTEFKEDTPHAAVMFMPEIDKETMGGTIRLGSRMTKFTHKFPDVSMSTTQLRY